MVPLAGINSTVNWCYPLAVTVRGWRSTVYTLCLEAYKGLLMLSLLLVITSRPPCRSRGCGTLATRSTSPASSAERSFPAARHPSSPIFCSTEKRVKPGIKKKKKTGENEKKNVKREGDDNDENKRSREATKKRKNETKNDGRAITGDHSKKDQTLLVKLGKYIGFCVYHRSYILWSTVLCAQRCRKNRAP